MKKLPLFALLAACLFAGVQSSHAQAFIGLQTGGTSISSYSAPNAVPTSYTVTGLGTDTLIDIDYFTSSTGVLYGMSSTGTLYSLVQSSATTYAATVASNAGAIPGATVIDFNPMANRLRVYAGNNNFRITPGVGGLVTPDGMLAFSATDTNSAATPTLVGAAYTNNFSGPPSTSLYSLDTGLNALLLNTGGPAFNTLTTVGGLTLAGTPFDIGNSVGFDITSIGSVNVAYVSNGNQLYTLNLANGALTLLGVQTGAAITDIAFIPEPGTYAMMALGGLGLVGYALRRRQQAAA